MNDLIKKVTDRTGIPADKAKMAVDTVISYLKDKLPAPIATQIDGVLAGGKGGFAEAAAGVGELLGKK